MYNYNTKQKAKPFLKWAGGKTQIINYIYDLLPQSILKDEFVFIEPFVGSGAVMFSMINNFPNLVQTIINDINSDLMSTYKTIRSNVEDVIKLLKTYENEYHRCENNLEFRKAYYDNNKSLFNARNNNDITQAALFIFLNKTCFNGLFRVNKENKFNVPISSNKKPMICDEINLRAVSQALQKVIILNCDFEDTFEYAYNNTFFYFDPPYKPLSKTSSFNAYSKDIFNDSDHIRLKNFCEKLDSFKYKWILSNSDLKESNPNNTFFDELFDNYNISRIEARRAINSNPNGRGKLYELLITNY